MGYLDRFLTARMAAGLSPRTVEWYALHLRAFAHWVGGQNPADPHIIRQFLAAQRERVSASTVDAYYRALRAYWNWMIAEGNVATSPMATVDRPKVPKRQPKRVSLADYERLLDSVPVATWVDRRDRLIIQLLFLCGVRVSELVGLLVSDVDMSTRLLRVIGKGDKERLVPIWPAVGPTLLEYLVSRPPHDSPMLFFASDGAGGVRGPLTDSGVRQRIKSLCRRAGIRHLTPHAFRHGMAMWLLNDGHADMSLVQKILGHSDIKTTQSFYADWLTDGMQSAYEEAIARALRRRN